MKCKAIILARGGSKGIPNKNIIDFCGQPLISHTIQQAESSKYVEGVYVSSDSEEILEISQFYGAVPIKRPPEISSDSSASEEALKHFIDTQKKCDTILFLQPTSPLRSADDIDQAIEKYYKNNYDTLFSAVGAHDFFVWVDKGGKYSSLTYDHRIRQRRQDISNLLLENGSFYIINAAGFLKHNNRLFGKIGCYVMEGWKRFEIDSYDDLKICELLFKTRAKTCKD